MTPSRYVIEFEMPIWGHLGSEKRAGFVSFQRHNGSSFFFVSCRRSRRILYCFSFSFFFLPCRRHRQGLISFSFLLSYTGAFTCACILFFYDSFFLIMRLYSVFHWFLYMQAHAIAPVFCFSMVLTHPLQTDVSCFSCVLSSFFLLSVNRADLMNH